MIREEAEKMSEVFKTIITMNINIIGQMGTLSQLGAGDSDGCA